MAGRTPRPEWVGRHFLELWHHHERQLRRHIPAPTNIFMIKRLACIQESFDNANFYEVLKAKRSDCAVTHDRESDASPASSSPWSCASSPASIRPYAMLETLEEQEFVVGP